MRRNLFLTALLVVILAAGIGAYLLGSPRDKGPEQAWQPPVSDAPDDQPPAGISYDTADVKTASKIYRLQIADSKDKQALGLGKRKTIGGDGMIFPYAKPQRLCFWMKDMHFPIDMIWLGSDKQVLKVQADVSPDSYPRTTYCQDNTLYVVELDAGQAKADGIAVGNTFEFNL